MSDEVQGPLQPLVDRFVKGLGGELVTDLIRIPNPPPNADYFFPEYNVIVELKSLTQDTFGDSYKRDLGKLVADWVERGLILIFGKDVPISLSRLPPECQAEWNALLSKSLQGNVIVKANKQIRATKRLLRNDTAKGVLLLASDGNKDLQPANVWYLASKVLEKKQPNGALQYSHLDGLAYFTPRIPVWVPDLKQYVFLWADETRQADTKLAHFLKSLASAWHDVCAANTATPIPRYAGTSFSAVRGATFPSFRPPIISVNYRD